MRTNDILIDGFEEIKILQRYLYMSEDHFIEIKNSIGVPLRIRMGENLHYYCKNMNFPSVPEICWSEDMHINTMLAIISQLKESKPVEFPERFESRWQEIRAITDANTTLNLMKWRKNHEKEVI